MQGLLVKADLHASHKAIFHMEMCCAHRAVKCTIIIPKSKSYKNKTKKSLVIMDPTTVMPTKSDSDAILCLQLLCILS